MHPDFQKMRIDFTLKFAMLVLLICGATLAKADKEIWLLADIHVMAPSLLDSSDNKAWLKDLADQRKMQDLSAPVFDALVERVIAEKPDALLICGDLTKDGEKASHDYVINKLTKIENAGIPVYVIPGNHDHGPMEECRQYANNTYTTAAGGYTEDQFRQAYKHFGFGDDSEIHDTSLSYAVELFPGLSLIGIDTGNAAHVRKSSIYFATDKANEARKKGNQVIAMAHHSLIPHIYGQESIMVYSCIDPAERLRDSLMNAGVKVVFTGHYHISDNTRYTDNEGREIYDLCTGSPISYPCDFRKLVFDDEFQQIKITTESITELEGYDDFPAYAKGRLEEAFLTWAQNWVAQQTTSELISGAISQSVADAFIIHAEGNEPENPKTPETMTLYDDILFFLPRLEGGDHEKIESLCLSMKSMLGDYPSEDESDNIVNDRELTITLWGDPSAIRGVQQFDNNAQATPWYTLQGQRLQSQPTKSGIYINKGRKRVVH